MPDVNYYWISGTENYYEVMADLRGYSETPLSGKFPGKTDASIYYTAGVCPTITDTYDNEGVSVVTDGPEPFTRGSTFSITPTATPAVRTAASPGRGEGEGGEGNASPATTTSTAGASELKAAGGVMMAMLGAMAML